MAEEKILKEDELILDEELDEVVGGTYEEIRDDANRLRALGLLPRNQAVSKQQINDALVGLGIGIGTDLRDDKNNKYYINHDKVSREKLWNYVYEKLGRRY